MLENWPPALSEEQQATLVRHAVDWSFAHGNVLMAPAAAPDAPLTNAQHAPFALFPSPWDRPSFARAYELQPIYHRLMHAVSLDDKLLSDTFEKLADADPFSKRLWDVWLQSKASSSSRSSQQITLGIHRSDYMLHRPTKSGDPLQLLQVEFNTIAASFATLSQQTGNLHRYTQLQLLHCLLPPARSRFLARRLGYFNESDVNTPDITVGRLPENGSVEGLAGGIAEAWRLYNVPGSFVLMVVQPKERNLFDQRGIEYLLFERYGIKLLRRTMAEIHAQAVLKDKNTKLFLGDREISVVYYRAGYGPNDYPTEVEWKARLLVEQSAAIKCPTIAYQLVGAKKIQQILAKPGMLETYLQDPKQVSLIRESFAGIYSLDANEEGDTAAEMAMRNPEGFVLKPQREGGGNNYYGSEIPPKLKSMSRQERSAFILMERIQPPPYKNALVRLGVATVADVVSELGVYGVYLHDGKKEVVNKAVGHLLRTKASSTNEGGVATGYAVIDSPLLLNPEGY